jgi:hypothetical protein
MGLSDKISEMSSEARQINRLLNLDIQWRK